MSLIANLPQIIMELVKAMPQIISSLVSALAKGIGNFVEIGANLVRGLWEGIQSLASWIWDKVSGWAKNLWKGIKNFFGIHSPSTKMAFIGDMLMEGLAEGIDETAGEVIDSASAMTKDLNSVFDELNADMSGVPTDFNVTSVKSGIRSGASDAVGGVTIQLNIDSFNNYSSEDIASLTNEIMETANSFIKRKEVVFG